jgi:glycosyltransferase involved in cell wall biosynthesis
MPAGVDTDLFKEDKNVSKTKNSVCMIGRISPVKRIELCLEAVLILINRGVQVSLTVLGPSDEKNPEYLDSLKDFVLRNNLSPYVRFFGGVKLEELPKIYNSHEIFVNLTPSGSFDKTIVEACACGLVPLVTNKSLAEYLPTVCVTENDAQKVADSLEIILKPETKVRTEKDLRNFVRENSLKNLMDKLTVELKK